MPDETGCSFEAATGTSPDYDGPDRVLGIVAIIYLSAFIALSTAVIRGLEQDSGSQDCSSFGRPDCVAPAAASPRALPYAKH
jgi:hypothetical protein